jgi:hypothetical protein
MIQDVADIDSLGRGGGGGGGRGGHGGGRRHWGRGPAYGYGYGGWGTPWGYGPAYEEAPPADKFVVVNPEGKGVMVVNQIPSLPAGWTFRRATTSESALNKPMSGMGQWAEAASALIAVGTKAYADKKARAAEKKAARQEAAAARAESSRAFLTSNQQVMGESFPWGTVAMVGVGVVALGLVGFLLLRK